MSNVCKILRWVCCFLIATAVSQCVGLLPWGYLIIAMIGLGIYAEGYRSESMLFQVIAAGIFFGGLKCFFGG